MRQQTSRHSFLCREKVQSNLVVRRKNSEQAEFCMDLHITVLNNDTTVSIDMIPAKIYSGSNVKRRLRYFYISRELLVLQQEEFLCGPSYCSAK